MVDGPAIATGDEGLAGFWGGRSSPGAREAARTLTRVAVHRTTRLAAQVITGTAVITPGRVYRGEPQGGRGRRAPVCRGAEEPHAVTDHARAYDNRQVVLAEESP